MAGEAVEVKVERRQETEGVEEAGGADGTTQTFFTQLTLLTVRL